MVSRKTTASVISLVSWDSVLTNVPCVPPSDGQMLNMWLGSRLLLYGTTQVAELYTLLGTIKEARVYQLELLRIAQRFHIPSWCVIFHVCLCVYRVNLFIHFC